MYIFYNKVFKGVMIYLSPNTLSRIVDCSQKHFPWVVFESCKDVDG